MEGVNPIPRIGIPLCAKLTHKIAAAAAAAVASAEAAAAAKISARQRHGENKSCKIFTKTVKTNKLQKTSNKSIKNR